MLVLNYDSFFFAFTMCLGHKDLQIIFRKKNLNGIVFYKVYFYDFTVSNYFPFFFFY